MGSACTVCMSAPWVCAEYAWGCGGSQPQCRGVLVSCLLEGQALHSARMYGGVCEISGTLMSPTCTLWAPS
jgi:hypothetical protein